MKLIVGLGNPEKKYAKTRHNIGFTVLDALVTYLHANKLLDDKSWVESDFAEAGQITFLIDKETILLIKPMTFMNNSGEVVSKILKKYPEIHTSDILVIHDDMGFAPGEYKMSFKKEANSHNGVDSIVSRLGTNEFWRLRVGIGGADKSQRKSDAAEYVLSKPSFWENRKITHAVVSEMLEQVLLWSRGKIN